MRNIRGSGIRGNIPRNTRDLPDTPPVDVFIARQVSWLAGHNIRPAFPMLSHQWTDWSNARRLQLRGQLRSCSVHHGHYAPDSRLSFRRESEEPRTL